MTDTRPARRYRFGVFEVDSTTGELRRKGVRVKLHSQPFQVLFMLLERPGEMLTREEICRELWPDGTFVDYEHGVNSAVNRLREALGDKASNPRFVETLARRGYRFLAPVERIAPDEEASTATAAVPGFGGATCRFRRRREPGFLDRVLAAPEDLPKSLAFRGADTLRSAAGHVPGLLCRGTGQSGGDQRTLLTAAVCHAGIHRHDRDGRAPDSGPYLPACAVLFHAPGMREKFLKIWPFLLLLDGLWSLAPFLLLHHINYGLALACMTLLVYSPFAQRSLILMGAGGVGARSLGHHLMTAGSIGSSG